MSKRTSTPLQEKHKNRHSTVHKVLNIVISMENIPQAKGTSLRISFILYSEDEKAARIVAV